MFNQKFIKGILLEETNNSAFQAWEICQKCGGYKWVIGSPPTTGPMCQCSPELFPIGWICPLCKKILAPDVKEHICDSSQL